MAASNGKNADHILVVAKDLESREMLVNMLETAGGYRTSQASNFEEALNLFLVNNFALALVDVQLPDLSGIDLLTAAGVLCNQVPVILIDDDLSAKSAVAAFRLGAIDYICKPINLDFILMRIDRELKLAEKAKIPITKKPEDLRHHSPEDRERRLNPSQRSAALLVKREQFTQINKILTDLYMQIKAQFVGLVDAEQNLIGAAGRLENADLILLTKALSLDRETTKPLRDILGETSFHSTHFEGERSGVYIIEFGRPHAVSLVVICPVDVKLGMVWHYSKRTALVIDRILAPIFERAAEMTPVDLETEA